MSVLLHAARGSVGFADDPIASHSGQFGLCRPGDAPVGHDVPSPSGVRPWNLRHADATNSAGKPVPLVGWHYDFRQQCAVDAHGNPVIDIVDATANSVSNLDGDEGTSEDWTYDYAGDFPGSPM